MNDRERRRQSIQKELDSQRTALERNRDGQFATPPGLARQIADYSLTLAPDTQRPLRILEPSCGSGAFISALLDAMHGRPADIHGVELDKRFADAANDLWDGLADVANADFLEWALHTSDVFDLLVANPPYVRHHHMSKAQKERLAFAAQGVTGQRISRLSGMYVYFMLLSDSRLAENGVASWLVPSEFMVVNYGSSVRHFLAEQVSLERVHLFDPEEVQFDDALVTSCVVTYSKQRPSDDHQVLLTYGDYVNPKDQRYVSRSLLRSEEKWVRLFPHHKQPVGASGSGLGDFFEIRRGIATGSNGFFIRHRSEFAALGISERYLRPVLPSPRSMKITHVECDSSGWPCEPDPLALLDCSEYDESNLDAEVLRYLSDAPSKVREGYLVRQRKPWYRQEQRPPAPILCTYMGRSRNGEPPFRFIRNYSRATATNTYLMLFPKSNFVEAVDDLDAALDVVCEELRGLHVSDLVHAGREYGGGLKKLEPREMSSLPFDATLRRLRERGLMVSDTWEPLKQGALFG